MSVVVLSALVLSIVFASLSRTAADSSRPVFEAMDQFFVLASVTVLPAFQMVGLVSLSDSVLISFQAGILLTAALIVR